MIPKKYFNQITKIVAQIVKNKKVDVFLFGSSVRDEKFGDCDLGLMGKVSDLEMRALKDAFEVSTIPYKLDVVNFNKVSEVFKKNVFNNKIIWIKRSN